MTPVNEALGDAFIVSGQSLPADCTKMLRLRVLQGDITMLADDEVVAVLLGRQAREPVEKARVLLDRDGLLGLARTSCRDLRALGFPAAASATLLAAFDLARRLAHARLGQRPKLATPEMVAALIGPLMARLPHEELWCLPLDSQSRLIGQPLIVSKGDVDSTDASARSFFRLALKAGATTAIAAHNYPVGDPTPSSADQNATRRLLAAGRTVELSLVDHVVIGQAGMHCSIRRSFPWLWC